MLELLSKVQSPVVVHCVNYEEYHCSRVAAARRKTAASTWKHGNQRRCSSLVADGDCGHDLDM